MRNAGYQSRFNRNWLMLIFLLVVLLMVIITNPSKEKHLRFLEQNQTIAFILDKLHADKDAVFRTRFIYHNYIVFSRMTYSIGDSNASASFGFAGIVF